MTPRRFNQLIDVLYDSIGSKFRPKVPTRDMWFKEYFQCYEDETVEKVFNHLSQTFQGDISLKQILDAFAEFRYSPPLHIQIKKNIELMTRLEKQGREFDAENIPAINAEVFSMESWRKAYKLFKEKTNA